MTASDLKVTQSRDLSPIKVKSLPAGVLKSYGCLSCEWRSTDDCPFKGKTLPGICDYRKEFLLAFTLPYDKTPSMDKWQRDFTLQLQHQQYLVDIKSLTTLASEIASAKADRADKKVVVLQDQYDSLYWKYHKNWTNVTKFNDAQITRDTPRKLEVTHETKVRPSDIARKIREARLIDVEVEVVEVKENGKDKISKEQETSKEQEVD